MKRPPIGLAIQIDITRWYLIPMGWRGNDCYPMKWKVQWLCFALECWKNEP